MSSFASSSSTSRRTTSQSRPIASRSEVNAIVRAYMARKAEQDMWARYHIANFKKNPHLYSCYGSPPSTSTEPSRRWYSTSEDDEEEQVQELEQVEEEKDEDEVDDEEEEEIEEAEDEEEIEIEEVEIEELEDLNESGEESYSSGPQPKKYCVDIDEDPESDGDDMAMDMEL